MNARLDVAMARKLALLQERTGKSATDVLRAAIDSYFAEVVGAASSRALLAPFVGCAAGDPDLSRGYKQDLAASLPSKLWHVESPNVAERVRPRRPRRRQSQS